MNKQQIKGQVRSVSGNVKQVIGKAVGNKKMEHEGAAEHLDGKIEVAVGNLKQDIKEITK